METVGFSENIFAGTHDVTSRNQCFEELGFDGKVILKWILTKYGLAV